MADTSRGAAVAVASHEDYVLVVREVRALAECSVGSNPTKGVKVSLAALIPRLIAAEKAAGRV